MTMSSRVLIVLLFIQPIFGAHFRGGAISWRPAIPSQVSVLGTNTTIIIDQRYTWSKSAAASACTSTTILNRGLIGELNVGVLYCLSIASTCTSARFPTNVSTLVPCTDYNTILGMSYGQSSTSVSLTIRSAGLVIGYQSTSWLSLQLGSGAWDLITYINMKPRTDNGLMNSSPTSSLQAIVYVPAGVNYTTDIDIPMQDVDGDDVECRFALSSNTLNGISVSECGGVCSTVALPSNVQLISGNNTCTLSVRLPSIGYYAVAIQLEDFMVNTSTLLSSVPLQFLLNAFDASNPSSTCTLPPVITSIPPDFPNPGDTVVVQVTVPYAAMVVAQTGCTNDTDTSITNFITSSPTGMLKTNLPFALAPPSYGTNLTWTPTIDQLGMTFKFCVVAVDSNMYSSSQYCFYFVVGPKTTTTTTTSTSTTTSTTTTTTTTTTSTSTTSTTTTSVTTSTSTSTTSTTATTAPVKPFDCMPLILGLGLGLGLPLLLLLGLLSLCYLCRWCPAPLRYIIRRRYGYRDDMYCRFCRHSRLFDDPPKSKTTKVLEDTRLYRRQYINDGDDISTFQSSIPNRNREFLQPRNSNISRSMSPFELNSFTTTTTSFHSTPPIHSLPTDRVEEFSRSILPSSRLSQHNSSILVQAFTRQNALDQ